MKKKIVVFTGAGISQESGIKTFRDDGGLWDEYNVEDVATIEGWRNNPTLVLEFYNKRRRELENVKPNKSHHLLKQMEDNFDITIFTQNVDNLHEMANSSETYHLHGELTKSRSTYNPKLVYDIGYNDINIGDKCPKGSQLRPNIIWFGEELDKDLINLAVSSVNEASVIIIIGTSLQVQPAASIFLKENVLTYYVDPCELNMGIIPKQIRPFFVHIKDVSSTGIETVYNDLLEIFI